MELPRKQAFAFAGGGGRLTALGQTPSHFDRGGVAGDKRPRRDHWCRLSSRKEVGFAKGKGGSGWAWELRDGGRRVEPDRASGPLLIPTPISK